MDSITTNGTTINGKASDRTATTGRGRPGVNGKRAKAGGKPTKPAAACTKVTKDGVLEFPRCPGCKLPARVEAVMDLAGPLAVEMDGTLYVVTWNEEGDRQAILGRALACASMGCVPAPAAAPAAKPADPPLPVPGLDARVRVFFSDWWHKYGHSTEESKREWWADFRREAPLIPRRLAATLKRCGDEPIPVSPRVVLDQAYAKAATMLSYAGLAEQIANLACGTFLVLSDETISAEQKKRLRQAAWELWARYSEDAPGFMKHAMEALDDVRGINGARYYAQERRTKGNA